MHDNAAPHRAAYTIKWMKKSNLLACPSSSPDFNPIENLCDHMDKQLKILKPTNVQQLQTMIEDSWRGITAKRCQDA